MSFFNSDLVQQEIRDIQKLQDDVYHSVMSFSSYSKEEKIKHIELLENLLEKQKILYTRVSLSDDKEAIKMKNQINEMAVMMGLNPGTDLNVVFSNMSRLLEVIKEKLDTP
jgi:predicted site-specific integrase-resolvase